MRLACTALCAFVFALPAGASAVCRVVMPPHDSGEPVVAFDPTTMTLVVIAPDQIVDYSCPDPDAPGTRISMEEFLNRGPAFRAQRIAEGLEQRILGIDREFAIPAAPPLPSDDELAADPTLCWDGSVAEPVFGTLVHVVVQPSVYAEGGSAGLVMPVPRRADINVAPGDLFPQVSARQEAEVHETIEFQEDPSLGFQCSDPHYSAGLDPVLSGAVGGPMMLMGCGDMDADGSPYYDPGLDDRELGEVVNEGGVVRYEAIPTIDGYEAIMLNASSLEALYGWMDENGFAHSADDDYAFGAYVAEEAWFMAVKVTPGDRAFEQVALPPLVVTWRGEEIPIMNRLQYQPGGGMLITDAFVIAPGRMGPADGDGTTLYAAPVDLSEAPMLAGFGLDEAWLTHLELVRFSHEDKQDSVLVAEPGEEVRPVLDRRREVRIAAPCCGGAGSAVPSGAEARRRFTETRVYVEGREPSDETLFFTSPSPDPAYCPGGDAYTGYAYDDDYYYACSVDEGAGGRIDRRRIAAFASWAPLLLVGGILVLRRRRR